MKIKSAVWLACFLMVSTPTTFGHGGGLDSLGCHHNRKYGGYHCHRGALAGRSFSSKQQALQILRHKSPSSTTPKNQNIPYKRNLYGKWRDIDKDCQNTRQEVLIAESLVPVKLDFKGCRVISGKWFDPYTGQTFTSPSDLDIDHFIPLAEVHRSGGNIWNRQRRQKYANDLSYKNTLIAVSSSTNRAKGDKDPARWLPPNKSFHCEYVQLWEATKKYWALTMDDEEKETIKSISKKCED